MLYSRFSESRVLTVIALFSFLGQLAAQTSLFVPRNYLRPYELGTRSWDGKPGPNYWQNRAAYTITASLEPKTRRLSGEETITYTNNSPDTLKYIRFKLQHDRYRKGAQRSSDVDPSDVSDEGTSIEALSINGKVASDKDLRRHATFLDVSIKSSPLTPKSSATFTLRWSYTLPAAKGSARECTCDSTTFFVPYWYPQIAVYDDINGWASHPYTGQQEFYHDFADYDVTISLPRGFQVWATGEWQNAKDILNPVYYSRWENAHTAADVISVFSEKELETSEVFKTSEVSRTAFRFKASDVPDFAFAASDHYNWDATSTVVDDKTGRRTFVSAAYNTASTDYPQVAKIAADGIRMMSTWLPGYPFPYPVMTVFNGDDGMEYPMMCNDVSTAPRSPMGLTLHEVSHSYFPFMMGTNEQDHAWMDEGWAAFFDYLLSDSLSNHTEGGVRDYSSIAGTENDVPPMVKSRNLTTAYRNAAYQRPSQAYFTLLDLLGYEKFHECMVEYMNRWKGKHPAPFDFFQTWNAASGQNLDWFWKPWFFDWGYPDLGIQGVIKDEAAHCQVILVERKGNIPVPIHLEVEYTDGSKGTFHQTATVWRDGKGIYRLACAEVKTVKSAKLGGTTIPDADEGNNNWAK
ncbi:MAG: M1 family metallopeptidase [Saprospiraceae bacterium]